MYLVVILALMVVLPVASAVVEMWGTAADPALAAARWFTFWAVGVRLLSAGLRQVIQPSFTAVTIFRIADPAAGKLVTEIGFGNLAMGSIATLSLFLPAWVIPAGLAGGLYLGMAGVKHLLNKGRSPEENVAMVSDLFVAAVLAVSFAALEWR